MFACLYAPGCAEEALLALAASFSPLVENTARDTVIFSIVGLGKLIGTPQQIAAAVARAGDEAGVQANLAISADPDTAVLAARHLRGITLIPPGREADRLGGLPVHALEAEPELIETLERWGVRTLAELAALPELGFIARFGEQGARLLRLARGETRRSLRVLDAAERFERRIELEHPQTLLEPLLFLISSLLAELMQGRSFNRVTLGLVLDTRAEHRRTLEFPVPVRDSKVVLKQLQFDLEAHPPQAAIVGIHVELNPVDPRALQHGLFIPQAPAPEKLQLTLARLAALVGANNVGSPELLDTHRPDAFRMRPFSPENLPREKSQPVVLRFAFRYYRPAVAAQVRVKAERPASVNAREVVTAAGPWRGSGDWWTTTPWVREEWDVELNDGGLYRVYRNLSGTTEPVAAGSVKFPMSSEDRSYPVPPYCAAERWYLEGMYD